MAAPQRRARPSVEQALRDAPFQFDFFQAVRLLEWLAPDRLPVGGLGPPRDEVVRFHVEPSLGFPPSAIAGLQPGETPGAPRALTITFFGLTGPLGALPFPYSELVQDRLRQGDTATAAFLDMFHHRLISLFFRAWEKHHPIVAYERAWRRGPRKTGGPRPTTARADEAPAPSRYLFDLIGLGFPGLRERHAFSDGALLFQAGLFAQRHRSAIGLELVLSDHFQTPIRVQQFQGQWLRLAEEDRSVLGPPPEGRHNGLGTSLVLGARVWDVQSKIRLRVGPLPLARYLQFLPGRPAFRALAEMARFHVGSELDIEVQVVLRAEDVPKSRLSTQAGQGANLGRVAWLITAPATADAEDAVFPTPS